jgi:hypothetical protein
LPRPPAETQPRYALPWRCGGAPAFTWEKLLNVVILLERPSTALFEEPGANLVVIASWRFRLRS